MRNNKKEEKSFKIFFPKWVKGRGFVNNKIDKSTVLINGLLLTCIGLSISSGFVDIVCYSGLSKSYFHLGTIPFAAAILYTIISIFLTTGKFWCGMKIGMLKELRTKLKSQNKSWHTNITKALLPWQVIHKFLIIISLLTAMSMSVNSIGAGIRTMQQNIDRLSTDVVTLIELRDSVDEGTKDKSSAAKANITGKLSAKDAAKESADRYWPNVQEWQLRLDAIDKDASLSKEEKDAKKAEERAPYVKKAPSFVSSKNIDYISYDELVQGFKKITSENEVVDASSIYEEAVAYDKGRIEETLNAIIEKEYRLPNGELISFTTEDGQLVNVSTAIARLQTAISEWQNDTGDVGESSKVFTLLAMYMKADETAGGMGAAEWMIMLFIFITGVIQEFLIALCTPSATIDRKTLSSVSRYCEWIDEEEKERFLLKVYKGYVGDGVFSQEDYNEKCRKCVELMEETEEDIIAKYSKKNAVPKAARQRTIKESVPTFEPKKNDVPTGYSDVVARKIKEVEGL